MPQILFDIDKIPKGCWEERKFCGGTCVFYDYCDRRRLIPKPIPVDYRPESCPITIPGKTRRSRRRKKKHACE